MVHVQSDAQPTLIVVAATGRTGGDCGPRGARLCGVRRRRPVAGLRHAGCRRENGHLWRFDSGAFDYGLPGGRVPGLRAGAAHVVSDGAGGALCRFGGARWRINGEQGSEAQPGRPARRRVRGVRRGDLDGAGQAVMPAVRRDADPDEGRRWSGTAIPCRTCSNSRSTSTPTFSSRISVQWTFCCSESADCTGTREQIGHRVFGHLNAWYWFRRLGWRADSMDRFLRTGLGVSNRGGIYVNLLGLEATRGLIADHVTWTIPAMNRMLVERATHPEMLRELSETLGGRWLSHEAKVFGLRAAEAGIARTHALSREEPFDEDLAFPDLDEKVRTRLGEDGPRIVLADPVPGPFGTPVQTFNLPAHLFRGTPPGKEEIDAARGGPGAGRWLDSEGRRSPTDLRPDRPTTGPGFVGRSLDGLGSSG